MSTKTIKTAIQFEGAMKSLNKQLNDSMKGMVNKIGVVAQISAKEKMRPHNWKETLMNSIKLDPATGYKVVVYTDEPYAEEIEDGLKKPEKRWYKDNPKLEDWAFEMFGVKIPSKGLTVGGKNSKVHPQGVKFIDYGFDEAVRQSDTIAEDELNKIR